MKKILSTIFALSLCLFQTNPTYADDIADIIVFQYNGQKYYYNDIEKLPEVLEKIIQSNECLTKQKISAETLMGSLINICRERRGLLDDLVNKKYGSKSNVQPTLGSWGIDNKWDAKKSKTNALKACIVDIDSLANDLKQLKRHQLELQITADLDACINSIQIDPRANSGEYCPTNITVSDEKVLANLKNLNTEFLNKKFTFMDEFSFDNFSEPISGKALKNLDSVLIYNGDTLIACQGGRAVQLGHPVFSGFEDCRGKDNQFIPGYGELPDGVYLINTEKTETIDEESWYSWGKKRVLLMPSKESETFGRNNLYLHGTEEPDKRRSGGCISLGTHIDEFVETPWFQNQKYILVITKTQL